MPDDDPEVSEMNELGRLERGRMGPLRAHHILIFALVVIVIGAILFVGLRG